MKTVLSKNRPLIAELIEAGITAMALTASFLLRFEFLVPPDALQMLVQALPLVILIKLAVFRGFGLRHLAWRHIGFEDLLRIAAANLVASVVVTVALRTWVGPAFPRSIYVLDLVLCLMLEVVARGTLRLLFDRRRRRRPAARKTLIYGAGKAGITVLNEIRANPHLGYQVVGFLDDDPAKCSMRIRGLSVVGGRKDLAKLVRSRSIEEILIALPAIDGNALTEILEQCRLAGVAPKRVPALAEIIESKVLVDQIREVRLEDLLGRPPVRLAGDQVRTHITGRVVLVTGAGGSIGSELCRQIAHYRPEVLVGFDHAETALYEIEQELKERFPDVVFCPEIGTIQDPSRLADLFSTHRPHSVYHAAAYKHVPMMESHLYEAVANNVFGTRNVARAAIEYGAAEFVLISSDKAVRPTNVMGATKRVAELVCLTEAESRSEVGPRESGLASRSRTKMVAVRFGNVLGSNGSVIPRFRRQIAQGGPVTVTHPEMRRFFMTIPEAAQLVIQAGCMGSGREIFVLEMGDPVRIVDLARKLVLLSGLRPDRDIKIVYSGMRPGEKMYEELSAYEEDTVPTPHSQIRVFTGPPPSGQALQVALESMRTSLAARDAAGVVMCLKDLVPDYNPSSQILRQALQEKSHTVVA